MGALVKRVLRVLLVQGALVLSAANAFAQGGDTFAQGGDTIAQGGDTIARLAGRAVSAVHLDVEGRRADAPELLALLDVRAGAPLDLAALRASVIQLYSAGRFEDVSVRAVDAGAASS